MKYIAYGSNMVKEQMAVRCPDARLIGMGYIEGARLEFYLHATVERTGDRRNRVPVAVWEISKQDEANLDVYEGVKGGYYTKENWPVIMKDGSQIEGMIYIMKMIRLTANGALLQRHPESVHGTGTQFSNQDGAAAGTSAQPGQVE